MYKDE